MATTIRTRNDAGQISYRTMETLSEIGDGTIIEILGQLIYAEQVEHFGYGETKITDMHGEITRWDSGNTVELLGSWNV